MSTHDPYEQHRAAFGAELRRAVPRARRRRRQRVFALGGATVALAGAATAVAITVPAPGSKLDVVAEAQAAIAADAGSIVHYAVLFDSGLPVDPALTRRLKGCEPRPVDLWRATAAGPPRYRIRLPMPRCGGFNEVGARISTGALEIAYADRTTSTYAPADGFLNVVTGLPEDSDEYVPVPPLTSSSLSQGDPSDPVAEIRSLLAEGKLTDAGQVPGPDGRKLRRLVAHLTEDRGDPAAPTKSPVTVEYRVDAETYAPVLISTTAVRSIPRNIRKPDYQDTVHRAITAETRFSEYEKLPLNRDTERLLTVQPEPGTDVVTERFSKDRKAVRPSKAERERAMETARAQIKAGTRLRIGFD